MSPALFCDIAWLRAWPDRADIDYTRARENAQRYFRHTLRSSL